MCAFNVHYQPMCAFDVGMTRCRRLKSTVNRPPDATSLDMTRLSSDDDKREVVPMTPLCY